MRKLLSIQFLFRYVRLSDMYLHTYIYIYVDMCVCMYIFENLCVYIYMMYAYVNKNCGNMSTFTHTYIYISLYIYYLLLSSLLLLSCVQMSSMELTSQCWCRLEMIHALSQTKDSPVIVTEVQCLHSSQEMQKRTFLTVLSWPEHLGCFTDPSAMKRPSATRALGKQIHKCGCCGSTEHRIEGCPEPGASKIRALTKKLKDSLEGRPVNHVLRQEKKPERARR